mmetsp:Transcript_36324/g.50454  ORF Transcript_36324/g.50454 Transcript_36324/m.50454 type:complete len:384 (-) Transcript_36324:139-1290(-)
MPPKAKVLAEKEREKKAQQKAQGEKRASAAADKTFGLKNKNKSKVVQNYVKTVTQGAEAATARANAQALKAKKEKEAAKAAAAEAELNTLFAVAIKQPKLAAGVDPKSVLCEFFRQGKCQKGFKCKYSHDLAVERKAAKIDLFQDRRDDEEEDGMESWDQQKLEDAIAQKHASDNSNRPTEIICKFFLDAIEKKQYGWFWQCPNTKDCKYRHALPPGYIMKSQMQALLAEQKANLPTTEELLEDKRRNLNASTPVTQDVFMEWKRQQLERKAIADEEKRDKSRRDDKISGRDLFESGEMVVEDDENAAGDYTREGISVEEQEEQAAAQAQANQAAARASQAAVQPAEDDFLEELCEEDFEGMDDLDESDLAELEAGIAESSLS